MDATPEFREWLDALRDRSGRARILVRIDRLTHGNPGDHRRLGGGISELRIDTGPGYRVYYSRHRNRRLLLLGGDKSTQMKDIARAIELAKEYPEK